VIKLIYCANFNFDAKAYVAPTNIIKIKYINKVYTNMINNESDLHAVSEKDNSEETTNKKPTHWIRTTKCYNYHNQLNNRC